MAYDNSGFMEKLRLNNVFPAEGKGLPNPLIGMPEFRYGGQQQEAAPRYAPQSPPSGPGPTTNTPWPRLIHPWEDVPKDTAYQPGAADLNAARIVLGETPNEQLGRQLKLQEPKNALGYGNLAIKSRAQDLRERVESGRATDAEKQDYAKELLGMRGDQQMEQIDARGDIGSRQIGERGVEQRLNTTLSGNQAMDRLGRSISSREGIADRNITSREGIAAGRNSGMLPTQQGSEQENRARQLLVSNPAMAQFVQIEPNGQFSIVGNPPLDVLSQIQKSIYGKPENAIAGDVELPAGNQPSIMSGYGGSKNEMPKVTMPKVTMPNAGNDPLGIR